MPLYEYECKNGHRTERVASVTTPGEPLETIPCPKCPPPVVRRGRRANTVKPVRAELVPSLTGAPKFKAGGVGGFYKANA